MKWSVGDVIVHPTCTYTVESINRLGRPRTVRGWDTELRCFRSVSFGSLRSWLEFFEGSTANNPTTERETA